MEISMNIDELITPCSVVSLPKLKANIEGMLSPYSKLGVTFRPHVKTHKSVELLSLFNDYSCYQGITVSTLKEAEYFAQSGVVDILYAVSLAPNKFEQVEKLLLKGVQLTLLVDSMFVAEKLVQFAELINKPISVLIEIDTDGHRAGLEPTDSAIIDIAKSLNSSPCTQFKGIMTHAGESYGCQSVEEIYQHAELERSGMVAASEYLTSNNIKVEIVSVGSTPTAKYFKSLDGVTEMRAGVFVFHDLVMAGLNVCKMEDISLSVLTTVISHKVSHNRLIIDAGGLALSKDSGTQNQQIDRAFGVVSDIDGNIYANLIVNKANQEHGIVQLTDGYSFSQFPIGTKLRILPVHACMTGAAYEQYSIENNGEIVDTWERCNGW